jgi:DNA-binding MarR family transcriptional regulator
MNDPDDEKLKAEIDKIMSNITKTIKRIEDLDLINRDNSKQNKD